ncbi:hypothetical protein SRHO_G00294960 [Serrasalmus rhombeus]
MTEEVAGRAVIGKLSKGAREKVILTSHQWLISLGRGLYGQQWDHFGAFCPLWVLGHILFTTSKKGVITTEAPPKEEEGCRRQRHLTWDGKRGLVEPRSPATRVK